MLHHVEIYVSDLERSIAFWTPFMAQLGWEADRWSGGMNYIQGRSYLCFLQAPAEHLAAGYHRKRVGLNHLAFHARSRAHVDEIAAWARTAGHRLLYEAKYPYASGPGYYAMYAEDPDRIKVEVVAPHESQAAPGAAVWTVRPALPDDRPALQQLLELYQYELSDIWDQPLDARGRYGYTLDRYFTPGSDSHAFVALAGGQHAGFALADGAVKLAPAGHWMDQFFVLRKHRQQGLGHALAQAVFRALPGHWEVGQMPANVAAQAFWRRCIGQYSGGRYTEHRVDAGAWQGVVQAFEAPPT